MLFIAKRSSKIYNSLRKENTRDVNYEIDIITHKAKSTFYDPTASLEMKIFGFTWIIFSVFSTSYDSIFSITLFKNTIIWKIPVAFESNIFTKVDI